MSQYLFNYGKKNLEEKELNKKRILFNLSDIVSIENVSLVNIEDYIKDICLYIKSKYNIDLTNFDSKITKKQNIVGFEMKWHRDDCSIHDINPNAKTENKINISDKHCLAYKEKLPIYTILIYFSDHNKDFTGGVLHFVDDTQYKPKMFEGLLFDSEEVHRVTRILSGVRKNLLIKFYKND